MSAKRRTKIIEELEEVFDSKSFSTVSFAAQLAGYPSEFREAFFEVAVNFIREFSEHPAPHPNDYIMMNYWEMSHRIVNAISR